MDVSHDDLRNCVDSKNSQGTESPKAVINGESDGDDESQALLLPQKDGLPKQPEKPQRKVQWLDRNGDKLAHIVEFEPSDGSDSEEEELDFCICIIL